MFSETIYISHSAGGAGGGPQVLRNGAHHNHTSEEIHYQATNGSQSFNTGGGRDQMRSYYKSRTVEKLYSDSARANRDERREVSCFVRSEIKWVFLKSIKVLREGVKKIKMSGKIPCLFFYEVGGSKK